MEHTTTEHTTVIAKEADRFAEVLQACDPAAGCPTCPEWNATDLLWHLAEVHMMWSRILARNVRSDDDAEAVEASLPARPETMKEMLAVRAQATRDVTDQLDRLADDESRWTWWEPEQTVGFTRRMQTYEATMHRVDAELTAGLPVSPIPRDVSAGAIDHCVDVMWTWMPDWPGYERLGGIRLHAGDTGEQWNLEVGHWFGTGPESGKQFDEPRGTRAHDGESSATVTADVSDLALWAWTRGSAVTISGEPAATTALRTLVDRGIP